VSGPLDGILVVAIEQAVAAPFATRQLADLGARVIKVERAEGDFARGYDDRVRGMASYFVWLNRGKESAVLDLKADSDLGVLREMIRRADVLVQNLAPGAIERMGFGGEDALAINPRLVHVSISGYGRGGPLERKKAYDLLIQCETGLLSVTGTREAPAKVGISIADIAAGMYAYSGVLGALLQRVRTGRGDILEISMLEALGEWMSQPLYFAMHGGEEPPRSGAQHASIAPYGPFDAADGRVFLGIQNEREWAAFCEHVLGDAALATDSRFASNTQRVRHRAELHERIAAAFATRSVEEVERSLDERGIANARVRSMRDFAAHPQLAARDRWRSVDSPVGALPMLRPPVSARTFESRMGGVPTLGEHSTAIAEEFRPGGSE